MEARNKNLKIKLSKLRTLTNTETRKHPQFLFYSNIIKMVDFLGPPNTSFCLQLYILSRYGFAGNALLPHLLASVAAIYRKQCELYIGSIEAGKIHELGCKWVER